MITSQLFGTTKEGSEIKKFTLKNKNNFEIHLLSYGLTIQKILYPISGNLTQDIVLGFDSLKEYEENQLYLGCIVGRNANRLSNGTIIIDDKEIQLTQNEDKKQLHGGFNGFDKKSWNCVVKHNRVIATYISPHLEEGFPGKLTTVVTFELTDDNELKINSSATTSEATVVNLTRHDYFNLKDAGLTDSRSHLIQVNGDAYNPTNKDSLVTGEITSVTNTPYDLRNPTIIKNQMDTYKELLPMGFDNNYAVNADKNLKSVAKAIEPESGRSLEILSTQPGIQFYTAAYVNNIYGKYGAVYNPYHGFCLETQHFPDATKHLTFSSTIITPETPYSQYLIYKFTS